jgi:eukaryotic-like serine/threonine-protein kinase
MATVDLARDEQLGRRVAVKRLSVAYADDAVFRERFTREARVAARLSHPNIVGVYDVGEDDAGVPFIVMEYVEGETLADVIRRGPLPPERAVDYLLQICAGLEHAHGAGLVHRDVKPQNLLVSADGAVKIADFGIARPLDATQLTQVGTVLGTAAYLAPEQAAGEPVTAAADIYSVGAVAYELLSGRTPWQASSLPELALKQREQAPPPIPDLPPQLQETVFRCLAVEPAARPRSAAALARELAQASPEPPTEPLPAPAVTAATEVVARPSTTITISRRALLAIAGLAALALLVGGLALAAGGDDDPAPPAQPGPAQRQQVPRGETPAESARLLAEWLRARGS